MTFPRFSLPRVWWGTLLLVILLGTGCSPALAPLYRDFEVPPGDGDLTTRIENALATAGWELDTQSARNVVTTQRRSVRNWGLYHVGVWLDVSPINDRYVRVLFHPYRYYITGNRSMIGHLNRSVRNALLPDLYDAFAAQGLVAVGTPIQRDRETTGQ